MDIITALLVDDDEEDYLITRDLLDDATHPQIRLQWISNYDQALRYMVNNHYDVYLVDYWLETRDGLDLMREAIAQGCKGPIIMLTGRGNREVDQAALDAGGAGFLAKDEMTLRMLERAIRYAVSKQRHHIEQLLAQLSNEQTREMNSLASLSGEAQAAATSRSFGFVPMKESVPDLFAEFVQLYTNILEMAVEQRGYRVKHDTAAQLDFMAQHLGFLNIGPRDVVEIHLSAVRKMQNIRNPRQTQIYMEEGRLLVLQLMGSLVNYYRRTPRQPTAE
ncbi:MAG: response regulator [Caldilineaceae bacterium]